MQNKHILKHQNIVSFFKQFKSIYRRIKKAQIFFEVYLLNCFDYKETKNYLLI